MRSFVLLLLFTIFALALPSAWSAAVGQSAQENLPPKSLLDVDAGVEDSYNGARQTRQFFGGYYGRPYYGGYGGYGGYYGRPYYGGYYSRPYYGGYGGYYRPFYGGYGGFYG